MNFKEFIHLVPQQLDPGIISFVEYVKSDSNFPTSSDPVVLGKYLYLKLNEQQTTGFQKIFIVYAQFEKKNELPEKYEGNQNELLNGVNTIVQLQNSDPEYKR